MPDADEGFAERLNHLGTALLATLEAFEYTRRQLHPPRIGSLREALEPLFVRLSTALREFRAGPTPEHCSTI